ncbi:HAD-IIA family hydrolase [Haloplanus pelagicus]|jgi:HAD superfamily hydrolase (TIGR01450 family)|uniref:HAD-IIA family hydrolase n=1 Tax=Haloplanus pelagicus TaxID=2949995 RepID=UPI0020406197|nr:HAD-IIA family hydrolase [Haloplanus sp. HW8-1]
MLADEYEALLFDLDGVVFVGDEPVRGAVETLRRLRDAGKEIQFVTNNSQHTRREFAEKLAAFGIDARPVEITSAASATAEYLADRGVESVYLVGMDGLRAELRQRGIADRERDADAVVVGFDPTVTYDDIATATSLVYDRDLPLVATSGDTSYPSGDGVAPGTGAILRAIEAASDTEATVVGKPNAPLFDRALGRISTRPVAMVGDTPSADVAGANRAGIDSILVSLHCRAGHDVDPSPDVRIETPLDLVDPDPRR